MHPSSFIRTLSILLLPLIAGCATILTKKIAQVEVVGPSSAEFSLVDGAAIPLKMRPDSTRYLELRSDTTHRIVARLNAVNDTVTLRHKLNGAWIAADLFTPLFIGIPVDGYNRSWFSLEGEAIVYVDDAKAGGAGSRGGWYLRDLDEAIPEEKLEERKVGVVVYATLGATSPMIQVPIFGNHVALGLGYRLRPNIELLAMYENQGCTQLTSYEGGDARPTTFECDMTTTTFAVEGRYFPLRWLYGTLSAGWMMVEAGSTVRESSPVRHGGFSGSSPAVAAGIGVRIWDVLTLEYRRQVGLSRIQVDPSTTGRASFGTFRYGIHLSF